MKKRRVLLSWSSGKDNAWALHVLQQEQNIDVAGLFCTVNKEFNRVAMHAVRVELVKQQAMSTGLPLYIIQIPFPCGNDEYEKTMASFISEVKKDNVECFAFGDIFLEDVRRYREERLKETGITPIFPLWGMPTRELAPKMVASGLKALITCIDPKHLTREFIGREYNKAFLNDIPVGIDPCGERGEFHSFVFDGPMLQFPIEIALGEIVQRDDFLFADIVPNTA